MPVVILPFSPKSCKLNTRLVIYVLAWFTPFLYHIHVWGSWGLDRPDSGAEQVSLMEVTPKSGYRVHSDKVIFESAS